MSERVAIVVGAGGDLGRVTAEKLAAAGFTVAGADRSEELANTIGTFHLGAALTAMPRTCGAGSTSTWAWRGG